MAEFQEVIRQRKRLCHSHYCRVDCPLHKTKNGKNTECRYFTVYHPHDAESIILKWAEENPEHKYPTYWDHFKSIFPNVHGSMLRVCVCLIYGGDTSMGYSMSCVDKKCSDCWHTPIPAHIAEKLGIKPLDQ